MRRLGPGLLLIAINLCMLIGIIFVWPQYMVAPGPLIPAHAAIAKDCFACHAPLQGASAARCISCHKIADIGLRTTAGVALGTGRAAFHQSLSQPDCMACHTDHSGPALVRRPGPSFAHDQLRDTVRQQCARCHRAPPTVLHAGAGANCAQCHKQTAWKPATFDHARLFALTGPHAAACTTCHIGGDHARYTCFGCHQHQPDQIRARHAREGIGNTANCVRCHRGGAGGDRENEGHGRGDD
jgi:hypothetical protein